MSGKERDLLKEILRYFAEGGLAIIASNSDVGETLHNAKELLAQPEQEPINLDQVDKHLEICDKSEDYRDGYSD